MRLNLPFGPPTRSAAWAATSFGFAVSGLDHPLAGLAAVVGVTLAVHWVWDTAPWVDNPKRRARDAALAYGSPDPLEGMDWQEICSSIRQAHPRMRVLFRSTCTTDGHAWYCAGAGSTRVGDGMIVVSMCVLAGQVASSRYALEHEVAHLTGRRWTALHALTLGLVVLPPVIGFVCGPSPVGLLWALPVVYALHLAGLWTLELACDIAAQRSVGRPVAVACWRSWARVERRPLWSAVWFALVSATPPTWLRLLVARVA